MVKIAAEASRKVGFRLKVKHGGMRIKRTNLLFKGTHFFIFEGY